jgi:cytoskeletal protein CcmA (bactofilin family)
MLIGTKEYNLNNIAEIKSFVGEGIVEGDVVELFDRKVFIGIIAKEDISIISNILPNGFIKITEIFSSKDWQSERKLLYNYQINMFCQLSYQEYHRKLSNSELYYMSWGLD